MIETLLNVVMTLFIPLTLGEVYLLWELVDRLNPLFDPKFTVNLGNWTFLSVSNRASRAGWYACCVAGWKSCQRIVKTAIDYDFRSKVDRTINLQAGYLARNAGLYEETVTNTKRLILRCFYVGYIDVMAPILADHDCFDDLR